MKMKIILNTDNYNDEDEKILLPLTIIYKVQGRYFPLDEYRVLTFLGPHSVSNDDSVY